MNSIDKLIKIFSEFPGIGPKQAKRFVYFLINKNKNYIEELKNEIIKLHNEIISCSDCKKYFFPKYENQNLCNLCSDKNRNSNILMIVSRDIDLENIEKSHIFNGKYFVLGGLIPILDKNPEQRIRLKELLALINRIADKGLEEIILGLDVNSEGEWTTNILKSFLSPIIKKNCLKISELGRGLSTGTELEYSDSETIKNALKNRS
ncbi:MAG: toprim domain-containing protein [bacterium]